MHKTSHAFETIRIAAFLTVLTATSFLSRTITRPPWIGLVMLCAGSLLFEVALIACLPVPLELRQSPLVRVLFVIVAALPTLCAIVVAIAANRRAPILPEIEYPRGRIPSVGAPLSRLNRWRELDR
jgi:hypothetical protein